MSYSALSIHKGYGVVHMNRFRVCVRVPRDRRQVVTIGARLLDNMRHYMSPNTASVEAGDRSWKGRSTLKFRGVARIRPFKATLPTHIPGLGVRVPVPARVRDWMAPDVHTDSVGVVAKHGSGFTVQTLKREFEDSDDRKIRATVAAAAAAGGLAFPVAAPLAPLIAKYLADTAVDINQHHFLAGRRGFRFDWGRHFGYRDDRVVFETVAIERFSSAVFAGSVIAMGTVEGMVRKVWTDMITRFCRFHRLDVIRGEGPGHGWRKHGEIHYMQESVADRVTAIVGNRHFPTMKAEHQKILEPR